MRSRFARLLLIFTALWLPLQAVEGMTMHLGVPSSEAPAVQQEAEADVCPFHRQMDDSAPAAPRAPTHSACDNCGVCHLAGAAYVPATEIVPAVLPMAYSFAILPAAERPSHIPEPPQYPPKRS